MLAKTEPADLTSQPKYLWFFMVAFTMFIAISNWYDARLTSLFGFVISPGALIFPISLLLSDGITEIYGYKKARLAIWTALFFNLLFICFGELITHLPSPNFQTQNEAFDKLLSMNAWIVFASFTSYLVTEPLNSIIMAKMKIRLKGKYIGIRFALSTITAALIDSILFISLAYYREISFLEIIHMIINIWLLKSLIEIAFIPISVRFVKWMKEKEELDIYDHDTNFNIFNLDSSYRKDENFFKHN